MFVFFFQAEDGIRDIGVTGVQTCALPISGASLRPVASQASGHVAGARHQELARRARVKVALGIVGELVLAEEGASLSSALERHVGMDARLLDGCYVLHGAVGRVTGHPPRLALPPE